MFLKSLGVNAGIGVIAFALLLYGIVGAIQFAAFILFVQRTAKKR